MKRFFNFICVSLLLFTIFDINNFALHAQSKTIDLGNDCNAILVDDTLKITGNGALQDVEVENHPLALIRNEVKNIEIEEGITAVGKNAFYNFKNAKGTLKLPSTLKTIGTDAFNGGEGTAPSFSKIINISDSDQSIIENAFAQTKAGVYSAKDTNENFIRLMNAKGYTREEEKELPNSEINKESGIVDAVPSNEPKDTELFTMKLYFVEEGCIAGGGVVFNSDKTSAEWYATEKTGNKLKLRLEWRSNGVIPKGATIDLPSLVNSKYGSGFVNIAISATGWDFVNNGIQGAKLTSNTNFDATTSGSIDIDYIFDNFIGERLASGAGENITAHFQSSDPRYTSNSNEVVQIFHPNYDTYEIRNGKVGNLDTANGLPEDYKEYYWAKYTFSTPNKEVGARLAEYFKIEFEMPSTASVISSDRGTLTDMGNGTYRLSGLSNSIYGGNAPVSVIVRSEKAVPLLEFKASLFAKYYCDQDEDANYVYQQELNLSKDISSFGFTYTGSSYTFKNEFGLGNALSYYNFHTKVSGTSKFNLTCIMPELNKNNVADFEITRDFTDVVVGSEGTQTLRRLKDDEIEIAKNIGLPFVSSFMVVKDGIFQKAQVGMIKLRIEVRYANEKDYVPLNDQVYTLLNSSQTIPLNNTEKIIGIKYILLNMDTSFKLEDTSAGARFETNFDIHMNEDTLHDIYLSSDKRMGSIYEFYNLQIFQKGILLNNVSESSYTGAYAAYLKNRDLDEYGHYVQRSNQYRNFYKDYLSFQSFISAANARPTTYEEEKGGYLGSLESQFNITMYTESLTSFSSYMIVPKGIEINLNSIRLDFLNPSGLILKDSSGSTIVINSSEKDSYIKKHMKIIRTKNYKNSGQEKIEWLFDFSDAPLDLTKIDTSRLSVKLSISNIKYSYTKESIALYGSVKKFMAVWRVHDTFPDEPLNNMETDDGSYSNDINLWSDINEDGKTSDCISSYSVNVTFPDVSSSIQQIKKKVKTNQSASYIFDTRATRNMEYNYMLYISTPSSTSSYLRDIVIYDYLENDSDSKWRGQLLHVDVELLKSMGLDPVIYYHTEIVSDQVPDNGWTTTKPHDASKIKAIAIDLKKNIDGSDAIIDGTKGIAAYLDMIAPDNASNLNQKAINNFSVKMNSCDAFGNVLTNADTVSNKTTIELEDYSNNVTFTKVNSINDVLHGGTFVLRNTLDSSITYSASASYGVVNFGNVVIGDYELSETAAPSGYAKTNKIWEVAVTQSNVTFKCKNSSDKPETSLAMINKKLLSFTFLKKGVSDNLLANAKFQLKDVDDTTNTYTATSSSSLISGGNVMFMNVPEGTYKLTEIQSPTGYAITNDYWMVTLNYDGTAKVLDKDGNEVENLTVINEKYLSLKVLKVDSTLTTEKLAGATFELYDSNDKPVSDPGDSSKTYTLTTTSTGEITFKNLIPGHYKLKEIKAPKDYELLDKMIEVDVSSAQAVNEVVSLTVTNKKISELPATGGGGTVGYLFLGVSMLLLSGAFYLLKLKQGYKVQKD